VPGGPTPAEASPFFRLRRGRARTGLLVVPVAVGVIAAALAVPLPATAGAGGLRGPLAEAPGLWDWPSYGHDAQHTFHGLTTLTPSTAGSLARAWFVPTGDAVTATPTVVRGTVYAGSWDGYFYAVDLRTGAMRWRYQLKPQPAVTPYPGEVPRDITSDGGLVTSSAWYEPGTPWRPPLVIFGGGYTLYALDAETGSLYWEHDYTGRPDLPPDPLHDSTRIFSSPVVADAKVIFGVSVDGEAGHRGYIAAASLRTGDPVWEYQTDVGPGGQLLDDGCGDVWSSGTLLPAAHLVVFGTADCHGANQALSSESVLALRIDDGSLAWSYKPDQAGGRCDVDFGASANAGLSWDGRTTFLGLGSKNGTYYSLDPSDGQLRWSTNVVFGGNAGGFIGTTAYDGRRVYGSTALGDLGSPCDPGNPRDTQLQEPTVHALDALSGAVRWQATGAASFGPTTTAGGMTFDSVALADVVQVRDAATGSVLDQLSLQAPCWSGIATVGDSIVFGTGSVYQGSPDGIVAFTPGGRPPSAPRFGRPF
jgi:outer membrane protein assembly factor BamB